MQAAACIMLLDGYTELYSDTRSYCWISQIMHTTICLLLLLLDRRKCHSRAVCAVVPWWLAGLHCNGNAFVSGCWYAYQHATTAQSPRVSVHHQSQQGQKSSCMPRDRRRTVIQVHEFQFIRVTGTVLLYEPSKHAGRRPACSSTNKQTEDTDESMIETQRGVGE